MMGGTYGRRVVVLAGKGNNGNDGRAASRRLERPASVSRWSTPPTRPPGCRPADLVIDAAYGTGFHGTWRPRPGRCAVLAVDIPSGVDGATGAAATASFLAAEPDRDLRRPEARAPAPARVARPPVR